MNPNESLSENSGKATQDIGERARPSATEVFLTGGPPTYTHVTRSNDPEDWIRETSKQGKILVLEGPTKSGKSTATRRAFEERNPVWVESTLIKAEEDLWATIVQDLGGRLAETRTVERTDFSGHAQASLLSIGGGIQRRDSSETHVAIEPSESPLQQALRLLKQSGRPLVVDDCHHLADDLQRSLFTHLKSACDHSVDVVVITLTRGSRFDLRYPAELEGRVRHRLVTPWEEEELMKIAEMGFPFLGLTVSAEAHRQLARASWGSPLLMQELCRLLYLHVIENSSQDIDFVPQLFLHESCRGLGERSWRTLWDVDKDGKRYKLSSEESRTLTQLVLEAIGRLVQGRSVPTFDGIRDFVASRLRRPLSPSLLEEACRKLSKPSMAIDERTPIVDWVETEKDRPLRVLDPYLGLYLNTRFAAFDRWMLDGPPGKVTPAEQPAQPGRQGASFAGVDDGLDSYDASTDPA